MRSHQVLTKPFQKPGSRVVYSLSEYCSPCRRSSISASFAYLHAQPTDRGECISAPESS